MVNTRPTISLEDMAKAGVHFGHHTSKWHPKMKDYIYGSKNSIHIIDLNTTKDKLETALDFISETVASGKDILFVSTKKQAIPIVRAIAEETGMPYMVRRWVGGIFTNFKAINKRVKQLVVLEDKLEANQMKSYTKKERKVFSDKVEKGNKLFAGVKDLRGLPGAVFVQDIMKDSLAIKEARDLNIPVIALADTNVNPELVNYIIPANDDAVSSIQYIYGLVSKTITDAKTKRVAPVADDKTTNKDKE
ncbi:MAG: 30S ribosomal protein S2 [Candidatus Paceibacterota bacterium]